MNIHPEVLSSVLVVLVVVLVVVLLVRAFLSEQLRRAKERLREEQRDSLTFEGAQRLLQKHGKVLTTIEREFVFGEMHEALLKGKRTVLLRLPNRHVAEAAQEEVEARGFYSNLTTVQETQSYDQSVHGTRGAYGVRTVAVTEEINELEIFLDTPANGF